MIPGNSLSAFDIYRGAVFEAKHRTRLADTGLAAVEVDVMEPVDAF